MCIRDRSYAHEITADPQGIAFAFGGVDPGTLHAHGKLVKTHSVHYSIGRAGRYLLHVGLRQQSARIAGSPFELCIEPGPAHAAWTRVEHGDFLQGVAGQQSKGVTVVSADRMGNLCLMGGAKLAVSSDKPELLTACEDQGNGTYLVTWSSEAGGLYKVRVTIDGVDVKGSPTSVCISARLSLIHI